jgi:hypothetical protein
VDKSEEQDRWKAVGVEVRILERNLKVRSNKSKQAVSWECKLGEDGSGEQGRRQTASESGS